MLPFAIAAATPLLLSALFGPYAGGAELIASGVLTVLLVGVALWVPWDRVPPPLHATVPLAYFGVVFLLRDSSTAATQLYTPLVLLPVIWLALYGTRARLFAAFVLLTLTLILPILVFGPPRYPNTEWRRVAIFLVIAPIVGITIQRLVAATRERGQQLAEQNARLVEIEGRLRTLLETGIAISSELSLDALLRRIVEAAARLTDAGYAALGVIDRTGTGLERFVTTGIDEETRAAIGALPVGRGILGVLISDARTLRLHEIGKDPRSVGFPPNHPPMGTFLGIPILLHGVAYGNLYLTEKSGGADFGDEDEVLVTLLAGQAAVAIENARLYEAERATRSRQERLQMVTDIALAHPEFDDLLSVLLPLIRGLLAADTCALFLVDEDSQELVARAALYDDPEIEELVIGRVRYRVGEGIVGRVAAEGKPVVLADVEHTVDVHPIVREIGIKSLCYVPLLMPGKVVGVLHVGTLSSRTFTDDDLELLQLAADRAATAIVRARLFKAERETAEALARTNEELRELDQMKDTFVSGVSHELRTPLTSMVGYLEILLGREVGELTDKQQHFLEIVERNSHRLLDLIDEILFMSRLDSGRFHLDPAALDLAKLVAERVESIRSAAAKKNVEIHLDIPDASSELWADASRLTQVIDNLLSNAVKFTPDGGEAFVVVATAGETASLEVRDTGVGIPEDEAKRLFERFFRASTAANIQGTGLGLSITQAIVEAHGGRISFDSTVGAGTTFTVNLPVTKPSGVPEEVTT